MKTHSRLVLASLGLTLIAASVASAQTPQEPQKTTRSAKTTVNGDTGLFFTPLAEVLPDKKFSFSLYRTNIDDGQGFTDISNFPITFGVGVKNRAEIFGSFNVLTRLDRDTRPLFFSSTASAAEAGTGGGILPNYPLDRNTWVSTVGDFWVGGKVNLSSQADQKPVAFAVRGMVKLPTGSKDDGTTSGKADFEFDGIVSREVGHVADLTGYAGYLVRGNPSGYELTNGVRWGVGAGFPTRKNFGFAFHTELFGEFYNGNTITAPAGQFGVDGSAVPTTTHLRNPLVASAGGTYEFPNGIFIGATASWNLTMKSRNDAGSCLTCDDHTLDEQGLNFRIGYHPGVRKYVPPPPPPPPPAPETKPTPAPNRPPTVRAMCDPCTVEVGKTSQVSADAQDPDGDALTYQWRPAAGSITSPTSRQTPWTAPMVEGPVVITVSVDDGKGGTASANTTINVVKPVVKEIVFDDVHFDFDRSALRPDALRVLDEAVTALQANPNLKIEIEGHTCNIGTAEYNMALGERRAKSVLDYLTSRGIGADRLRTVSYGEERPKYDNAREETRRMNRRAVLTVRIQ